MKRCKFSIVERVKYPVVYSDMLKPPITQVYVIIYIYIRECIINMGMKTIYIKIQIRVTTIVLYLAPYDINSLYIIIMGCKLLYFIIPY